MHAPLYMYFVVLAKLFLLGAGLIGGVPLLEHYVQKEETQLGSKIRIIKIGSTRYVEIEPEDD